MCYKMLTTLQHKINKKNMKKVEKKRKNQIKKKEKKLLERLKEFMPEEIIIMIYEFVDNNIKFNLSFYKQIFQKFIYNFNNNNSNNKNSKKILSSIFTGYVTNYSYCSHVKTAINLKQMLRTIPLDILQKYLYYGTPNKYFNIAFPEEPNLKEYIGTFKINDITTRDKKEINTIYENYIFEILDLLSYFATKVNEFYSLKLSEKFLEKHKYFSQINLINNIFNYDEYNKINENFGKENEKITRILILSILFIYDKYGRK
uniref:Uncharacterized protein n=1 Tax=viral metagenome TaxID=1070528 RepID=A0A6C0KRI5_9ZZZZ